MSRGDPIAVVEAAYGPAESEAAWLARVVDAVGPQMFTAHGGVAAIMDGASPDPTRIIRAVDPRGFDARLMGTMKSAFEGGTDKERARSLESRLPVVAISAWEGPLDRSPIYGFIAKELGVVDVVSLRCANPDGSIVFIATPLGRRDARAHARNVGWNARWSRLTAHVAAGLRLQLAAASADSADAVFAPDGRLVHAKKPAERARDALRRAVIGVDRARGPLRRRAPDDALDAWSALASGRWSLVDTFDTDGKRFVLAIPNAPNAPDPRALKADERPIASYVSMGYSNKLIAYTLGVPIGTVATHVRSIARKLGVSSRVALIERVQTLEAAARARGVKGVDVFVADAKRAPEAGLSAAEHAVASLALRGRSNAEIARTRGCSERTVANLLARVYRKLGVTSRAELAARGTPASSPPAGDAASAGERRRRT